MTPAASGAAQREPMHFGGLGQGEIEHRRERGVEAEGGHGAGNQFAMFAGERGLAGLRAAAATACAEGMAASAFAQAVDGAAFHIDAAEGCEEGRRPGIRRAARGFVWRRQCCA